MPAKTTATGKWDAWGQVLSLLCLAHCLLVPVLVGMLPVLAGEALRELPVHLGLVVLAGGVGAASFVPGFRAHGDWRVLGLGGGGLLLLVLALAALPEGPAETGVTVAGAALLVGAHGLNRRHGRECRHPTPERPLSGQASRPS
jgi:hypothetical protein